MPLHGAAADEQLCADLGVGSSLAGQLGDLLLLRSQVGAGIVRALARLLAGRLELRPSRMLVIMTRVLLVIDVQESFRQGPLWPVIPNPGIASDVARLVDGAGKRRPRPGGAALREGCCPSPTSVQAT